MQKFCKAAGYGQNCKLIENVLAALSLWVLEKFLGMLKLFRSFFQLNLRAVADTKLTCFEIFF